MQKASLVSGTKVRFIGRVASLVVLTCAIAIAAQAEFKKISPPRSTFTTTLGVNNGASMVVGWYVDSNVVANGYAFDGTKYRVIHYPGTINYTLATAVNKSNVVTGVFVGSDTLNHGFLLKGKQFIRFDVAEGLGTEIAGINDVGSFIGDFGNDGDVRGFLNIDGAVTQFDGGTSALATYPHGVDNFNNVVGMFIDTRFVVHGFYRAADGTTTQIDYPGALNTTCLGINDKGVISGYYEDRLNVIHGFLESNGVFAASPLPSIAGINNDGVYVGSFTGTDGVNYGYVRSPKHGAAGMQVNASPQPR